MIQLERCVISNLDESSIRSKLISIKKIDVSDLYLSIEVDSAVIRNPDSISRTTQLIIDELTDVLFFCADKVYENVVIGLYFTNGKIICKYDSTKLADLTVIKYQGDIDIEFNYSISEDTIYNSSDIDNIKEVSWGLIDSVVLAYFKSFPTGSFRKYILGDGILYDSGQKSFNEYTINVKGFYSKESRLWHDVKLKIYLDVSLPQMIVIRMTSKCKYAAGILVPGSYKSYKEDNSNFVQTVDEKLEQLIYATLKDKLK
jgi:hypothetical protein